MVCSTTCRLSRRVGRKSTAVHATSPLPSKFSSVKPAGDRVLIKLATSEPKSAGGILLPTVSEVDRLEGEVVAVGETKSIQAGGTVMFSRYAGTKIKIGDDEHVVMKEADVIGTKGSTMADLKPTEDRILIKVAEEDTQSAGGVILTGQSTERPTIGEVVAVGPGSKGEDGETQPVKCDAGAQVLYSRYSGVDFEEDDVKYVVVRESDVLAVLS